MVGTSAFTDQDLAKQSQGPKIYCHIKNKNKDKKEKETMVLNVFALVVMIVLVALCIALVVILGPLPGKIAKKRNHAQADAIQVMGWIGLVTLGVAWLIALVWAYTKPSPSNHGESQLAERVSSLEKQVQQPISGGQG